MDPRSKANAVWFINADVTPQLYLMSLAVGTGGAPVFMPAGGLSASPYGSLLGKPVIEIEQCSTLGTVGDVILADMTQYLLIDKGGIEGASSIHLKFNYDETVFRFVYRVDGQPTWAAAVTPFKDAATTRTISPFVTLATRA
jgi:HK97 family phage major capsid protein